MNYIYEAYFLAHLCGCLFVYSLNESNGRWQRAANKWCIGNDVDLVTVFCVLFDHPVLYIR